MLNGRPFSVEFGGGEPVVPADPAVRTAESADEVACTYVSGSAMRCAILGSRLRYALTGSQRYRLTGSQRYWLTGSQRYWFTGSQRYWLMGSQRYWLMGSQRYWLVGSQRYMLMGSQRYRLTGSQRYWQMGSQRYWLMGSQRYRLTGSQRYWQMGSQRYWLAGSQRHMPEIVMRLGGAACTEDVSDDADVYDICGFPQDWQIINMHRRPRSRIGGNARFGYGLDLIGGAEDA